MQNANAIAQIMIIIKIVVQTAAITAAREDRDGWLVLATQRRYVAARLVGCRLVASVYPPSPPPPALSWWCLLCPLRFYFVAIWHFANWPRFSSLCHQKRKFYFVRLKLLRLFFSVLSPRIPCPAERQDFHCRCSGYGYCFPLFIAGDAKSIKDQLLLSISQSERE